MSDYIKSNYTKTGKKVKSINYDSIDLTYNEIYDVFIDSDKDEFIIDDVGDKRYGGIDDKNYYELVDDVGNNINTNNATNETKLKFKVGDKVKVVDIGYISQATSDVKVGNVGVITYVDSDYMMSPYRVEFDDDDDDDDYWWFTDKCIELVDDNVNTTNETKLKFKVGDTVKVTSIDYICQYNKNIKVGDVGVITDICSHKKIPPYCVFDWYFPEDDLELVAEYKSNNSIKSDGSQIVSDGGSSSYYTQQIPKGMLERFNATGVIEAKDVIRLFLGNDFNMGNIFKAYCRVISLRNGKGKAGIDEQYDLTKAKYFTEDELNYYLENNVN